MQYIQGNPLGRGHSVSLLSFKSNSFRPIRQIWGFCSVALICFCCLARCLFCVDNAEVADLLQDGAFDVCTKILSVALMHWLLVLRIANPYIKQRRVTDPPQRAIEHPPRREGLLTILILTSLLHKNHATIRVVTITIARTIQNTTSVFFYIESVRRWSNNISYTSLRTIVFALKISRHVESLASHAYTARSHWNTIYFSTTFIIIT